jgi:hypothetical protein
LILNTIIDSVDVSSWRKRLTAVAFAILLLEKIRLAEENYIQRMPFDLQGSDIDAAAESSVDMLTDVIITLSDVYG